MIIDYQKKTQLNECPMHSSRQCLQHQMAAERPKLQALFTTWCTIHKTHPHIHQTVLSWPANT